MKTMAPIWPAPAVDPPAAPAPAPVTPPRRPTGLVVTGIVAVTLVALAAIGARVGDHPAGATPTNGWSATNETDFRSGILSEDPSASASFIRCALQATEQQWPNPYAAVEAVSDPTQKATIQAIVQGCD